MAPTTWTLTFKLEKKLNYTKMLRASLNRSWQDHLTNKELYMATSLSSAKQFNTKDDIHKSTDG